MKHYPEEFWEQGSHGHAHGLLAGAELPPGVVLDLGCASGPLAEPVAELGHEYVGADIDAEALTDLAARGFETHGIDLGASEDQQVATFREIVGDRALRCVLLLDVLEHLPDPAATLRALGRLVEAHDGLQIVVSIPNVSHVDLGIKLLMGRWDLTDIGLLDDTHIRFFNHRLVTRVMAQTGWVEQAADDVVNAFSDQLFPADAPALRPGTPLRQLLWRVRTAAEPHGETYQFVRRYAFDPDAAAARLAALESDDGRLVRGRDDVFLSVVTRVPGAGAASGATRRLGLLVHDLARQAGGEIEVLVSHDTGDTVDDLRHQLAEGGPAGEPEIPVRHLVVPPDQGWCDHAVAEARGRYVAVLDHRTRVTSAYLSTLRQLVDALPGRVVQLGARMASLTGTDDVESVDELVDRLEPVELDPLDLVSTAPFGAVTLDAHAIPRQAWASNGLRFHTGDVDAGPTLFLLRAVELCGMGRTSEVVTVVHPGVVRDVGDDIEVIGKHLSAQPMVLPEGAGSQLFAHRQALATLIPERDALVRELTALRDQVESLSSHLRDRDGRIAALEDALTQIENLPEIRLRHKAGAIKRRLLHP